MNREEYTAIERYMLSQMRDSAHDRHHVYRVLNAALDIAGHMNSVDTDILAAACLLHDIGRERQFAGAGKPCHALIGGEMAYNFLLSRQWPVRRASHVRDCIASHRYRGDNPPISIEAKILFDADKLDVAGAVGIARTLIYIGQVGEPLYIIDDGGNITIDRGEGKSSFLHEYNFKLKNVYDALFTERAKEIAARRQKTAADFYNGLFDEITQNYTDGKDAINAVLKDA